MHASASPTGSPPSFLHQDDLPAIIVLKLISSANTFGVHVQHPL
jgi:hypothetical protein